MSVTSIYLPVGPVPSWPSSEGVNVSLPTSGMTFFSQVNWALDGDTSSSTGNNAQISAWLAAAKTAVGEAAWKNLQP